MKELRPIDIGLLKGVMHQNRRHSMGIASSQLELNR